MRQYLLKRLAVTLTSFFIAFCISFWVFEYAPGNRHDYDSVKHLESGIQSAKIENKGSLTESLTFHENAVTVILKHTKISLLYWSVSFFLTFITSILLSYYACFYSGRMAYPLLRNLSLFFYKVPPFLTALLLLFFANSFLPLAWFKMEEPSTLFSFSLFAHLWLPVLVYLSFMVPYFFLQLDTWVQEENHKEYLIALRARGFSNKAIFFHHLLPNLSQVFLSVLPLIVRNLLVLSVVIELTCQIHGFGFLSYLSFTTRDTPVLLSLFLFACLLELSLVFVTDCLLRGVFLTKNRQAYV